MQKINDVLGVRAERELLDRDLRWHAFFWTVAFVVISAVVAIIYVFAP